MIMANGKYPPLREVLPGFVPSQEVWQTLQSAIVFKAAINSRSRTMGLTLSCTADVDEVSLETLKEEIKRFYSLSEVTIALESGGERPSPAEPDEPGAAGDDRDPAAASLEEEESPESDECGVFSREGDLSAENEYTENDPCCVPERDAPGDEKEDLFEKAEQLRREAYKQLGSETKKAKAYRSTCLYGSHFKTKTIPMSQLGPDTGWVAVEGEVFSVNNRLFNKRGAAVISFEITDYTNSVRVSKYMEMAEAAPLMAAIKPGVCLRVKGRMTLNKYDGDLVLEPASIVTAKKEERTESAPQPRVELHLHTQMSAMDALTNVEAVIKQAAAWGQKAIAITDHGVAQAFPDAMKAAKKYGVKVIYGVEAYLIEAPFVRGKAEGPIDSEFIAFDVETTGLDPASDVIIEYGAVLFRNGEIAARFNSFADPGRRLSQQITDLTGITDEMLSDAPSQGDALRAFLDFAGGRPLAAHNADFDIAFLRSACDREGIQYDPCYIDTLALAQTMLPGLAHYRLDDVAAHLNLGDFRHHRAQDDAAVVAKIIHELFARLIDRGVSTLAQVNDCMAPSKAALRSLQRNSRHVILLAATQEGLRNLYKLISFAHLEYFYRHPLTPRHRLESHRSGLLIGSACESGELFRAVVSGAGDTELRRIASAYDYLEIQPVCNNDFLINEGKAGSTDDLMEFNRRVVRLGEELGIPVVATGDVHFLDPKDEILRRILLAGSGFKDSDRPLPLYFRSTADMLGQFAYLGEEKAFEVVVANPNAIADRVGALSPVPTGLYPPKIDNSREELESLVWTRAKELYGDDLPPVVRERLEAEMKDIIGCNYDVIYISAARLVRSSNEAGYLVGSRGSVGSSLVAYMAGITEVNALGPHYRCPSCRASEFVDDPEYNCGADLPDKLCKCGTPYEKDGFSIPFETFLGFGGDKIPDIDLNFSSEHQAQAHRNVAELFGADKCFRAGTIGTLKEKTAYGFVKKYIEERGLKFSRSEENRLALGCCGVKRTTGQHPGGIVVIPNDMEIYSFCPVQHPADDADSGIITTHFEYHAMEDNLLKLDLLGHDDPTMLKIMGDSTGIDVRSIRLDDSATLSLFTSSEVLGYKDDPILGPTGATAIPEFGTGFVRGMLVETQPKTFEALIRISGFSHGTDVWLGNARDYLLSGTATLRELIGCRDDIMLTLIGKGMPETLSFSIMESVRKGRGLKDEWIEAMKQHGVRQWYIDSCQKCSYLFPKAHAAAYVIMAFRIAYFKVHYPIHFYAAYFSVRAKAMDAAVMCMGMDTVRAKLRELTSKSDLSKVEEDMLVSLEACYEFYLRGFKFAPIDLYTSHANRFTILDDKTLLPPFNSVNGLGDSAAADIVEKRVGVTFVSVDDFASICTKVTKAHIEGLRAVGAFDGLPESAQLSLF